MPMVCSKPDGLTHQSPIVHLLSPKSNNSFAVANVRWFACCHQGLIVCVLSLKSDSSRAVAKVGWFCLYLYKHKYNFFSFAYVQSMRHNKHIVGFLEKNVFKKRMDQRIKRYNSANGDNYFKFLAPTSASKYIICTLIIDSIFINCKRATGKLGHYA